MRNPSTGKVPVPALERLATYLRYLLDLQQAGVDTTSSADVAAVTGINAAQFRKDLSYFGEFGKPGVGYPVAALRGRIEAILSMEDDQAIILIGAGNLGAALVGYPGLREYKMHLVAVFDSDITKIGRRLWDVPVLDIAELPAINRELRARIAILAVPRAAAQGVADLLTEAGVCAILNFAPVNIRVPAHVMVRNVSFAQELAVLSYHVSMMPHGRDDGAAE